MDDVLISGNGKNVEEAKKQAYERLEVILGVLEKHGFIAYLEKLQEGEELDWCGYIVSSNEDGSVCVLPSPSKVTAITEFPTPTTRTEVRRFLGMTSQIAG